MPTEKDVVFHLSKRYSKDSYAFLPQVRSQTGYQNQTRTADAVALSLWPSRGHELEGFEVKVSRSDWLNELKNHKKAEEIFQFCDRWWLVTHDKEVARLDEIPKPWGWMVVSDDSRVKIMKKAPELKSKPLSKSFVCAIFRKIEDICVPSEAAKILHKESFERGKAAGRDGQHYETQRLAKFDNVNKIFKEKIGVDFSYVWEMEEKLELIKMVLAGKYDGIEKNLLSIKEVALKIAESAAKELESFTPLNKEKEKNDAPKP